MPRIDGGFSFIGVTFSDGTGQVFHVDVLGFFILDGHVVLWHGPGKVPSLLDTGGRYAVDARDCDGACIAWGSPLYERDMEGIPTRSQWLRANSP